MPKKINLQVYAIDMSDIQHLVCNVGSLWRRLLNAKIKSLRISGTEARALVCIARHPGLTQIQIANLLDIEPQNLIRTLDKLEKLNYIKKQADANDRRIKCLYITSSAKKIINKIHTLREDLKPRVLSGIETKNIQIIINHLTKIHANILEQLEMEEVQE